MELTFKDIEGKKVALVSIDAEPTTRKIVEVSLVNELVQHGSFILIPKQDIQSVKNRPSQDPRDEQHIASQAGADFALNLHVLDFSAETREGYSKEEVMDSQLAEEMGTQGKTERFFKVKELIGRVELEWEWTHLASGQKIQTKTEAQESVRAEAKNTSIHLPLRMQFLAQLTQKAVSRFFKHLLP